MHSITSSVLAVLSVIAAPALGETLQGLVVFTRHGDRTSKFYKGYEMTSLGENQMFDTGSYYRSRYIENGAPQQILGISEDKYKASQLWTSTPDQSILLHTATDFLQGLYPPLGELNKELAVEKLTNGTEVTGPLNGYQFIWIHGESDEEPDTIWIKGDDECPAFTSASKDYRKSAEYLSTLESSREFYSQFVKPLDGILPAANVSYAQAFDVFDLLNVGRIHNESVADAVTESQLDQLRYYADSSELALNYNKTVPTRSIGGMTMSGGVLRQLDQTISTQGKLKLSLMAGSYDTMLSFFGLTNLTETDPNFKGLPDYASNLAFELFTEADVDTFPSDPADLRIRFLFRNGTSTLKAFPLFGRSDDTMPYSEFKTELGARSISNVKDWCAMCQSEADFCSLDQYAASSSSNGATSSGMGGASKSGKSGLTVAQAGVVGAFTTLGVVALLAGLMFLLRRRKSKSAMGPAPEKLRHGSDTGSGSKVSA